MEREMTVTEAARNFADVVNRAYYRQESTLLKRNGKVVARIVPVSQRRVTGAELAQKLKQMAHLSPEDAEEFERELNESRSLLKTPTSKWD